MSIRTIVSTFAATIAHLARDAQSPAPPVVVPDTLTRARELVSAVHRVATTSLQDARALLDGTFRFAAYALGYQRTATTNSPPLKPEVTELKPQPTDVKPQPTELRSEATELKPQPTDVKPEAKPEATDMKPQATDVKPQPTDVKPEAKPEATDVKPQATDVKPDAASDRAPPGQAPMATAPSRGANDAARPPTTTDPIAAPSASPPTTPTRGASKMSELIEAIRAAVAQGATAEQKAIGAHACRTILTAIGAEPGKPIVLPGAPKPHPLSGITVDQALDLVVARLAMIADAQDKATANAAPRPATAPPATATTPPATATPPAATTTVPPAKAATAQAERRGPRIAFVPAPPRGAPARGMPQRPTQPVRGKP